MAKRLRRSDVALFDEYFEKIGDRFYCKIENCNKEFLSDISWNRRRHIKLIHPKLALENGLLENGPDRKKAKISVAIDQETYTDSVTNWATNNSLPFSFFDSDSFRSLLGNPMSEAFNITVNSVTIKSLVRKKSNKIRDFISQELKGIMFSL